jgi:hypothetical protein
MDSVTRIGLISTVALLLAGGLALQSSELNQPKEAPQRIPYVSRQDLVHLEGLGKTMKALGAVDTAAGADITAIEKAWIAGFRSRLSDSTVVSLPRVERFVGNQIALIDSLLAAAKSTGGADSAPRSTPQTEYIADAISSLVNLGPNIRSVHASRRSALLVISSVICPCGQRRCEKMLKVYDSVAAGHPTFPMSVVDEMKVTPVIKDLRVTGIPSWVLFDTAGEPATIINGFAEADSAKAALESWLGGNR